MQLQDSYWLWWSKQNKTLQNNTSDSKADFQQLEYNGKNHELSQSKAAHSNLNNNIATVTVTPRPVVMNNLKQGVYQNQLCMSETMLVGSEQGLETDRN